MFPHFFMNYYGINVKIGEKYDKYLYDLYVLYEKLVEKLHFSREQEKS